MKLKKIASLALAGVMAISMLAGCSNNSTETPVEPVEPGTNGISAEVGALIEDVPAYVTFKDSSDLDSDLKYAVEFAGVWDVLPTYVHVDTLQGVAADVYNRLTEAVDTNWANYTTIGDEATLLAAETANTYEIDDAVAVDMRAVSSAIGENAVKQQIAEMIDDVVVAYEYSTRNTAGGNGGNYNHEYTVSISTYTKAVNSSFVNGNYGAADPAVTFIAVQVVRTSTHQ